MHERLLEMDVIAVGGPASGRQVILGLGSVFIDAGTVTEAPRFHKICCFHLQVLGQEVGVGYWHGLLVHTCHGYVGSVG